MSKKKFNILVTSHESLCEGYLVAAKLIVCNDSSHITAIPFIENMDPAEYEGEIKEYIDSHASHPLLILTDLLGGTPNNTAMKFIKKDFIHIISGINLPLLLEVLIAQESGKTLSEIKFEDLIVNAQQSIIYLNPLLEGGKIDD